MMNRDSVPRHLNPAVQEVAKKILGSHERVHLIDPLDVQDMHNLMARSYLIMTDSGGFRKKHRRWASLYWY